MQATTADQFRLANLINDKSDDGDLQRKIDQIIELTSATRDQAAVALHDCDYDTEKAIDMILEGDHTNGENQWKSAGKKRNKQQSQAKGAAAKAAGISNNNLNNNTNTASNANNNTTSASTGEDCNSDQQHPNQHSKGSKASNRNQQQNSRNQSGVVGLTGSNNSSLTTTNNNVDNTTSNPPNEANVDSSNTFESDRIQNFKASEFGSKGTAQDNDDYQANNNSNSNIRTTRAGGNRRGDGIGAPNRREYQTGQNDQRSPRRFNKDSDDMSGPKRGSGGRGIGRGISNQDDDTTHGNRRNYGDDDKRFGARGGRGAGSHRSFNQRSNQATGTNSARGVRTILNRGLQSSSSSATNANPSIDGFPNSIDTWTNSTAETVGQTGKSSNPTNAPVSDCSTLRVGQWSDVAGTEDWSEEDWDAKVMETKVFTPSSKAVDSNVANKGQPNLSDTSVPSQLDLATILSKSVQNDSHQNATVTQSGQSQQSGQQKASMSALNDNARAVFLQHLHQQQNRSQQQSNMGQFTMSQYNKEASESLKSLVGIPSSNLISSGDSLASKGPHQQQRLSNKQRSTRIPDSAVEMPLSDQVSSLNVQFGALKFGDEAFPMVNPDSKSAFQEVLKSNKMGSHQLGGHAHHQPSSQASSDNRANSSRQQSGKSDLSQNQSVLGSSLAPDGSLKGQASKPAGHLQQQSVTNQYARKTVLDSASSQASGQTAGASSSPYNSNNQRSNVNDLGSSFRTRQAYQNSSDNTTTTSIYPSSVASAYSTNPAPAQVSYPYSGYASQQQLTSSGGYTPSSYTNNASSQQKSALGLKDLDANTSGKGIPSVPPGTLPLMSQPQYIMGNAYQPAIFPYPFQADVHYQAATAAGREQNFQSVYSPGDAPKFSRGADGETSSISTTQAAGVASQTHNQPFVANALHPGYQLTYAMPGAFNMLPQNLYGAAPIFPTHIPQPTNTGSANTAYPKSAAPAYQSHTGYSGYDSLPQQTQDYVKQTYAGSNIQQQQQQQPTNNKSMGSNTDIGVSASAANTMYSGSSKSHAQLTKQANYDSKSYQQQQSSNPAPQQFGFSHNTQQTASFPAPYPILPHSQQSLMQHHIQADNSSLNATGSQQQAQQKGAVPVAPNNSKYYGWN